MRPQPRIPHALRFAARELDALPDIDDVARTRVVGPTAIMLRMIADIFDEYGPRRFQEIEESRALLERLMPALSGPLEAKARACLEQAQSVDCFVRMDRLEDIADAFDLLLIDIQEDAARATSPTTEVEEIDRLFTERALRWLPPMAQPGSISNAKNKERQ